MLKTLLQLAKMQIRSYTIYKSTFFLFTLNKLVMLVVYICVWYAIYKQTGSTGNMSLEQMITYYILVASLDPLVEWGINQVISRAIRKGQLSRELLSPMSFHQYYFGIEIGEMSYGFVIGTATFIIASIFWTPLMPTSITHFIFFMVIILLNIIISYFVHLIVGMVSFYTNSTWGMEILRRSTVAIFSGLIAPLELFPMWFQNIASILPFKELLYTPINIYLGTIPLNNIPQILLKQVLWIVGLYCITKIFFNHSIKKVTINGG